MGDLAPLACDIQREPNVLGDRGNDVVSKRLRALDPSGGHFVAHCIVPMDVVVPMREELAHGELPNGHLHYCAAYLGDIEIPLP